MGMQDPKEGGESELFVATRMKNQRGLVETERTCTRVPTRSVGTNCDPKFLQRMLLRICEARLERACRGDHHSPESLAAVHEGEHRSHQHECAERSEEVPLEEGALQAREGRGQGSEEAAQLLDGLSQ